MYENNNSSYEIKFCSLENNGFSASPSIEVIDSTDGIGFRSKSPEQDKKLP